MILNKNGEPIVKKRSLDSLLEQYLYKKMKERCNKMPVFGRLNWYEGLVLPDKIIKDLREKNKKTVVWERYEKTK
jgi:hypothetical protein